MVTVELAPAAHTSSDLARRLVEARDRTLAIVAPLDDSQLGCVIDRLMSPLVWDLGHIAAYADLWLSRRADGAPALRPESFGVYDASETPRADRGSLPFLDPPAARAYLDDVLGVALDALDGAALDSDVDDPLDRDGFVFALLAEHEAQHNETMLQCLQLAGIAPGVQLELDCPVQGPSGWVRCAPACPSSVGVNTGFAYDNERPRHGVDVAPFSIAAQPVTVDAWRAFIADGGYTESRWWSTDAWCWREEERALGPRFWDPDGASHWVYGEQQALVSDAPVRHVSGHEADAFAAWSSARLPTEAEWEVAASAGALHGRGVGWEWTATDFTGYPGFSAFPYPEYSEVFFDQGYRVLRGGSVASAPSVRRTTFRNWDHPKRRQIFSGVRLVALEGSV